MIALLACLLLQSAPTDVTKLSVHDLVKEIPRFGDHSWDLGREKEPPLSVRAQSELRERIRKGCVLDLSDWKTILLEKGYLRWRTRWPRSEPFAVGVHLPPVWQGLKIELKPRVLGWKPADATNVEMMDWSTAGRDDYQELGKLFARDREIAFDITVTTPLWDGSGSGKKTRERKDSPGSLTLAVEPVERIDMALVAVTQGERWERLRRELREGLRAAMVADNQGVRRLTIDFTLKSPHLCLVLSLDALACERGAARDSGGVLLRTGMHNAWRDLEKVPGILGDERRDLSGWTIRVVGSERFVLRDWDAKEYWAGEVEVPLAGLIRR